MDEAHITQQMNYAHYRRQNTDRVLTLRCLFCHGYEEQRGIVSGYLGSLPIVTPALVIHLAENAAQRSEAVTLYTQVNEELAGQLQPVANSKFKFEARQIKRLINNPNASSIRVEFVDGT